MRALDVPPLWMVDFNILLRIAVGIDVFALDLS